MDVRETDSWARWLLTLGAASALIGVAAGAFGAHALASRVGEARLATWETAARYQLVHALALIAAGLATPGARTRAAGALFGIGTLLFCGSLYLLVLTDTPWLGAVTPLGGLAFMGGWLAFAAAPWSRRPHDR